MPIATQFCATRYGRIVKPIANADEEQVENEEQPSAQSEELENQDLDHEDNDGILELGSCNNKFSI